MSDNLSVFDGIMRELAELRKKVGGLTGSQTYLKVSTNNTANPPTAAELSTAFGAPSTHPKGFVALLDDNNAHTNVYLIASDGTNYWHVAMTKAV